MTSPASPYVPSHPEHEDPKTPVISQPAIGFAYDDAFSDDEDSPKLLNTNILDDLAENLRRSQLEVNEQIEGVSHDVQDPDASVSTIDINHASISSTSTLSEHSVDMVGQTTPESQTSRDSAEVASFPVHHSGSSYGGSHNSFPSVVIDLAKPPDSQITVMSTEHLSAPATHPDRAEYTQTTVAQDIPNSSTSPPSPSSRLAASQTLPPRTGATSSKLAVHRATKSSAGPSTLEKVISKTRPTYLPPKQKDEDNRHLADWAEMMKRSRAADEMRQRARRERRLARERFVEENTVTWEARILPDVKAAAKDPKMRRMWWQGVPPKLRGAVWEKVAGNALALSKDNFKSCLARARRALDAGTFPTTTLNLIDEDIRSTLPALHLFTPKIGPMHDDLFDILCAWVVSRSDEGLGYTMGASKIAAMLLLNMQSPSAFLAMRNLIERHCLRSFFGGFTSKDDVDAYYRIFDTLLADYMPKMYFNFKQHQISPASYLPQWLLPIFLDHLPLDACSRIWDVLMLEGDSFLFRVALAVLACLEPRLFFPEKHELLSVLNGENKAAIEIARRNGSLIGACKFEIYDLSEDAIWEQLESMENWWKESTWVRLTQRELPDL